MIYLHYNDKQTVCGFFCWCDVILWVKGSHNIHENWVTANPITPQYHYINCVRIISFKFEKFTMHCIPTDSKIGYFLCGCIYLKLPWMQYKMQNITSLHLLYILKIFMFQKANFGGIAWKSICSLWILLQYINFM